MSQGTPRDEQGPHVVGVTLQEEAGPPVSPLNSQPPLGAKPSGEPEGTGAC